MNHTCIQVHNLKRADDKLGKDKIYQTDKKQFWCFYPGNLFVEKYSNFASNCTSKHSQQ